MKKNKGYDMEIRFFDKKNHTGLVYRINLKEIDFNFTTPNIISIREFKKVLGKKLLKYPIKQIISGTFTGEHINGK